tara:strand:+ start:687 stop:1550 length:864 start_codon:yes stop_codon:yes gene_type:complete
MKLIIYFLEYVAVILIYLLNKILPLNFSIKLSSFLFMTFGEFSNANKTAINNCKYVFPNLKEKEIKKIINKSWYNLGITICELLRLNEIFDKKKVQFKNLENIEDCIKNNKQAIFISIHQSNWEVLVPSLDRVGITIGGIYRHINNVFVDKLILNIRKQSLVSTKSFYTPKGKKSARDIVDAINNSLSIVLLVDQKDSSGEDVIFFNKKVKTQTGFLKIARKYKLPIIPIKNRRNNNGNIELTFLKPFYHNDLNINDLQMMENIHKTIEEWIKSEPSQWFWQHKRFS